jgi:hypothetical protein
MRDEAMRPRPLCMSARRHATPNEPRNVLVESQVIMPIGIGTLAAPPLVRARSPRRRRCVGGAAEAGRDADPRAGTGASLEGGEVPIGGRTRRSGRRNAELRQPTTSVDAALAEHRRDDPRWTAVEGIAAGGGSQTPLRANGRSSGRLFCQAPPKRWSRAFLTNADMVAGWNRTRVASEIGEERKRAAHRASTQSRLLANVMPRSRNRRRTELSEGRRTLSACSSGLLVAFLHSNLAAIKWRAI